MLVETIEPPPNIGGIETPPTRAAVAARENPIIVRVGRPRALPSIRALPRARGGVVWCVLATISGKQKKKIVGSREEAELVAHQWATAQGSDLRVLPTRLTPSELRAAEAAVALLSSVNIDVLEGVRYLLKNYQRPSEISWEDAITRYETDRRKVGISASQISNVTKAARRLAVGVKRPNVGVVSKAEIESVLDTLAPDVRPRTYNGFLADIRTWVRWGGSKNYLASDPSIGIEARIIPDSLPDILSPARAEPLHRDVEATAPTWIPYVTCCLFAALRPGTREGEALRFDGDLRAGRKVVHPGGLEVRGKANGTRIVPWAMTGLLREWLKFYPPSPGLWPANSGPQAERWWSVFRAKHPLSADVLRHTGISAMAYSADASLARVALAAGNSEGVIQRNYLGRWSAEDTTALWAILPIIPAVHSKGSEGR